MDPAFEVRRSQFKANSGPASSTKKRASVTAEARRRRAARAEQNRRDFMQEGSALALEGTATTPFGFSGYTSAQTTRQRDTLNLAKKIAEAIHGTARSIMEMEKSIQDVEVRASRLAASVEVSKALLPNTEEMTAIAEAVTYASATDTKMWSETEEKFLLTFELESNVVQYLKLLQDAGLKDLNDAFTSGIESAVSAVEITYLWLLENDDGDKEKLWSMCVIASISTNDESPVPLQARKIAFDLFLSKILEEDKA
jgi:hypothetical protein